MPQVHSSSSYCVRACANLSSYSLVWRQMVKNELIYQYRNKRQNPQKGDYRFTLGFLSICKCTHPFPHLRIPYLFPKLLPSNLQIPPFRPPITNASFSRKIPPLSRLAQWEVDIISNILSGCGPQLVAGGPSPRRGAATPFCTAFS